MRSASMRETSYSRSVRRRRRNDSMSVRNSHNMEEVRKGRFSCWIASDAFAGEQQPVTGGPASPTPVIKFPYWLCWLSYYQTMHHNKQ